MFASLNLGTEAMRAAQGALGVIGHNIANINTEGYSRQRAILETSTPQQANPGQRGTGVSFDRIQRLNDAFTKIQINSETRKFGEFSIASDILDQMETILNEPDDNGLQVAISDFLNSFHTLANNPEDFGARSITVQKGVSLGNKLNFLSNSMSEIQAQVDDLVNLKVDEVNAITERISSLNNRIASAEAGGLQDANDLRDIRELELRNLNQILSVTAYEDENNLLIVETQGAVLVAGTQQIPLGTINDVDGHLIPADGRNGAPVTVLGGEFKGLLDARDSAIDRTVENIYELSKKIIEEVNRLHSRGATLDGHTQATGTVSISQLNERLVNLERVGDTHFTPVAGSFYISAYSAVDGTFQEEQAIAVDPNADSINDIIARVNTAFASGRVQAQLTAGNKLEFIGAAGVRFQFIEDSTERGDDSDLLMAMGINTLLEGQSGFTFAVRQEVQDDLSLVAAGNSSSPGDNRNALAIAALKESSPLNNGASSFEEFYAEIVSRSGTDAQVASRNEENQASLLELLDQRLASTTGVSLDEEAANMLTFQRMFQAAAKYVRTMDSVLETLILGL